MNTNKKIKVLLVSLVFVLTAAIGVTLAFITAKSNEVNNTFEPGYVTTAVIENFDNKEKDDVKIKNTGNVHAYIRAQVVVTWQDESGNVYGELPVEKTDYSLEWSGTSENGGWVEGVDGFYYYTQEVAPCSAPTKDDCTCGGCMTSVLFTDCKPLVKGPVYKDSDGKDVEYTLHVEVIGSGIQSLPETAVSEAWPAVKVDANGNLVANN